MASSATGLEQILADLKRIEEAVSPAGIAEILKTSSEAGIQEARSRVRVRTGALRDSINWEGSGTGGTLGSDKEYAAVQETGGHGITGQPYVTPGALVMVETVQEELNKAVSSGRSGAV